MTSGPKLGRAMATAVRRQHLENNIIIVSSHVLHIHDRMPSADSKSILLISS